MGASAISLPDGWSLQGFRCLQLRLGMGFAVDQLPFRSTDYDSRLSDRIQKFRGASCALVGAGLGVQSLRLVLVDSLDMGHDVYSAHPGGDFSGSAGDGGVAGISRLDSVWHLVGRGSVGESFDAVVPVVLRGGGIVA